MSQGLTTQDDEYQIRDLRLPDPILGNAVSQEARHCGNGCDEHDKWQGRQANEGSQGCHAKYEEASKQKCNLVKDSEESDNISSKCCTQDHSVVEKLTQSNRKIEQLRKENSDLKKSLLKIQKNYQYAQESFRQRDKHLKEAEKMIQNSNKGQLVAECVRLKRTIKDLTEEVENFSILNEKLFDDLKTQDFFQKYHELSEKYCQIQKENERLIDLKITKLCVGFSKTRSSFGVYDSSDFFNTNSQGRNKAQQDLNQEEYSSYFSPSQPKIKSKKVPSKGPEGNQSDTQLLTSSRDKRILAKKKRMPLKRNCNIQPFGLSTAASKTPKNKERSMCIAEIMKSLNSTQLTTANISEDACGKLTKHDSVPHQDKIISKGNKSPSKTLVVLNPKKGSKRLSIPVTSRSKYLTSLKLRKH
ncbi:unnamed protein product [Moneuplotes crassus]|uniref:Uncharacterized protein n=1 Tax=Euplotes crassus TaxID=5936 RepID=A0AAD1UHL6_EUPCR|nr:unnamed protein product [Moneuplotes crassus]